MVSRKSLTKNVADWGQPIIRLVGRNMMNMGRAGEVRGLIIEVASVWRGIIATSKAVAERS